MVSEVLSAVGLVAAVVAVYYAWRSAELGRLERRERALRSVVNAIDEVRRTADDVIATYDGRRDRVEQNTATLAFRRAQERLRLAVAANALPAELASDDGFRDSLTALLGPRPLTVVNAAAPALDEARRMQALLHDPGPMARVLRRGGRRRRPLDVESGPRPAGGCAVHTTTEGARRLERVIPAPGGGLTHLWRDPDDPGGVWCALPPFATGLGEVAAAAVCLGNFGAPDSLEIVARVGGRLHHISRPTSFAGRPPREAGWSTLPIDDACGAPSIIQGVFGNRGNFEVVTPTARGGLVHLWRNNDLPDGEWAEASAFGRGESQDAAEPFDAVALIHGDLQDHLEVIARRGAVLVHFWRTNGSPSDWIPAPMLDPDGHPVAARAAGVPAFIQSRRRGSRGNFEVVTPIDGGGLQHLWRDNDDPTHVWRAEPVRDVGRVEAAAVFEGELRHDGTRDLLIFAHASGSTLHLSVPQPLRRGALRGLGKPAETFSTTPSGAGLPAAGEPPVSSRLR